MKEQEFFDSVRPAFVTEPSVKISSTALYNGCPCCDQGKNGVRLYDKIYSSEGLSVFTELELIDFKSLNSISYFRRVVSKGDLEIESREYQVALRKDKKRFTRSKGKKELSCFSIDSFFQELKKNGCNLISIYPGLKNVHDCSAILVDSSKDIEMHTANVVSAHAQYDPFFGTGYSLEEFNHPRDQDYVNLALTGGEIVQEAENVWNLCLSDSRGDSFLRGNMEGDRVRKVLGRNVGLENALREINYLKETGREIAERLMKS